MTMKKILWILVLLGTGCASTLFLNSFRFLDGNKFAVLSSPAPSISSSAQSQPSISSSSPQVETSAPSYNIGQTINTSNMELKVVGVNSLGKSLVIPHDTQLEASGTWKVVTLDVTNSDTYYNSLATTEFLLKTSSGSTFPLSNIATTYYSKIAYQDVSATQQILALPKTELPPSVSARIYLLFDVAEEAENVKLVMKPLSANYKATETLASKED